MFSVTYEIVTPESAENGDADERGFISQSVSLREALRDVLEVRCDGHCGSIEAIEASCSELEHARWITVYNGAEYLTGACESRSLHWPEHITPASRARILRLVQRG
jgi:hypothetical protein